MEAATLTWRDGKRYIWPLGLLVPTLPLIALGLVEATGGGAFWFAGPVLLFAVFPLVDEEDRYERAGHPRAGFPAGTPWSEVPDHWPCPDCGVRDKLDLEPADAP